MWTTFGDDQSSSVPWPVAIVGLLLSAGGAATLIKLLDWWAKDRARRQATQASAAKTTIDEWREHCARQDAQIGMLQAKNDQCASEREKYRGWVIFLHGKVPDGTVGPLKEFVSDMDAADVENRSLKQGSVLLHQRAKEMDAAAPQLPGGPQQP